MTINLKQSIVGVALLAVLAAQGSADTFNFGGAGFNWFNPDGGSPNHIWVTGGYWDQTFSSGLASASHADFHLSFDNNTLGQTLDLDALINGNAIGSFVINPGDATKDFSFDFAAIAGTNYDIKLIATNTIDFGRGSVSMLATGSGSYASLSQFAPTPEPCTMMLGLASAGMYIRRRRQAKKA